MGVVGKARVSLPSCVRSMYIVDVTLLVSRFGDECGRLKMPTPKVGRIVAKSEGRLAGGVSNQSAPEAAVVQALRRWSDSCIR